MKLAKAKSIVASYLTGHRVQQDILLKAFEVARMDEEYLQYLSVELGTTPAGGSNCVIFLSRVAEFSEMSEGERQRETPELLSHVKACPSCRRAYWRVRPVWVLETAGAVKDKLRTITKVLIEPIRIAVDRAGRLLEVEGGTAAYDLDRAAVGSLMGGHGEPSPENNETDEQDRRRWVLSDEDANCHIRLLLCVLPSGETKMSCVVEAAPPVLMEADRVRVEVRSAEDRALFLAGRLADFRTEPILLPEGSWSVELECPIGGQAYTYKIPVNIEGEKFEQKEGLYDLGE